MKLKLLYSTLLISIFCNLFFLINIYLDSRRIHREEINTQPKKINTETRLGTYLYGDNINFKFAKDLPILLKKITADLVPLTKNKIVNFDDVNSFKIKIFKAEVHLTKICLENLFRNYIFNFKDSVLILESIHFTNEDSILLITGQLKFVYWLNFEMKAKVELDKEKQFIKIIAKELKALGLPYTKELLSIIGLNLEKLIPIPPNTGIFIKENSIYLEPFKVLPPPKLDGYIEELKFVNNSIVLNLNSEYQFKIPQLPVPQSKNFIYLFKGEMKFGKLIMVDTDLQLYDKEETDPFDFYLIDYFRVLTLYSKIAMTPNSAIKVEMPDYNDVIQ
jgi:hypothetical protein